MPTTSIRIEDSLKARLAAAAARTGKTPDAFILDAITQSMEQSETDAAFHRIADDRWAAFRANGKTITWDDTKTWLIARSRAQRPAKPTPHTPNG